MPVLPHIHAGVWRLQITQQGGKCAGSLPRRSMMIWKSLFHHHGARGRREGANFGRIMETYATFSDTFRKKTTPREFLEFQLGKLVPEQVEIN